MIIKVFSVKDSRADAFMQPFFGQSTGAVLREFTDMVNSSGSDQHPVSKHPEDYELWHLADFDDSDGTFNLIGSRLAFAKDLKVSVQ